MQPVAQAPIEGGRNVSGSFVDDFFALSFVLPRDRQNPTILALLRELEGKGYTIDQKMVVFGPSGGYWPLLKSKGVAMAAGLAVSVRGGRGIGPYNLEEYLKREVERSNSSDQIQSIIEQKLSSVPLPEASIPAPQSTPVNKSAILQLLAKMNPNMSLNMGDMSLEDLRTVGIFTASPTEPQNTLSQELLLGSELFVTNDGRCLIKKGRQILACSQGFTIASRTAGGSYYHRNNIYSDVPFTDPVKVRTSISVNNLDPLLPYLHAIPLYNGEER